MSTQKHPVIAHVTLNTGDVAIVPHSYLTDHAGLAQLFKRLVNDGGGAIPAVPHIAFIIVDHPRGAATVSINVNSIPRIMATLCYDSGHSEHWWNLLRDTYERAYDQAVELGVPFGQAVAGPVPPCTPWLGAVVLSTALGLDPDTAKLLAAIEENIAIAFLELQQPSDRQREQKN